MPIAIMTRLYSLDHPYQMSYQQMIWNCYLITSDDLELITDNIFSFKRRNTSNILNYNIVFLHTVCGDILLLLLRQPVVGPASQTLHKIVSGEMVLWVGKTYKFTLIDILNLTL